VFLACDILWWHGYIPCLLCWNAFCSDEQNSGNPCNGEKHAVSFSAFIDWLLDFLIGWLIYFFVSTYIMIYYGFALLGLYVGHFGDTCFVLFETRPTSK
jgi:hypothetical protein